MSKLDPTDMKIVLHLLENGRDSYRDIAKEIGISPATVMKRVKAMEKAGVIKHYGAVLDYDKIGYDLHVIVDVRVAKGKLHMVEKKISRHANVLSVYDNTGAYDATVIARFRTRTTLDSFLKKLQTYDFVERTDTKLVLSTISEKSLKF